MPKTRYVRRSVSSFSEWEAEAFCKKHGFRGVPSGHARDYLISSLGSSRFVLLEVTDR